MELGGNVFIHILEQLHSDQMTKLTLSTVLLIYMRYLLPTPDKGDFVIFVIGNVCKVAPSSGLSLSL